MSLTLGNGYKRSQNTRRYRKGDPRLLRAGRESVERSEEVLQRGISRIVAWPKSGKRTETEAVVGQVAPRGGRDISSGARAEALHISDNHESVCR